jgi:hypothetical protein
VFANRGSPLSGSGTDNIDLGCVQETTVYYVVGKRLASRVVYKVARGFVRASTVTLQQKVAEVVAR